MVNKIILLSRSASTFRRNPLEFWSGSHFHLYSTVYILSHRNCRKYSIYKIRFQKIHLIFTQTGSKLNKLENRDFWSALTILINCCNFGESVVANMCAQFGVFMFASWSYFENSKMSAFQPSGRSLLSTPDSKMLTQ